MIDPYLAFSRPLATAATLAASAADAHRFTNKVVLVTGEDDILCTENGTLCFLNTLRLLVRHVSNVEVFIPASLGKLRGDTEELARKIQFGKPVRLLAEPPNLQLYDAIVNVGWKVLPSLPSTTINAGGWIARVSSTDTPLSQDCGEANPIAALAAACLGISDVFKRLIALRQDRAEVFDALEFSLWSCDIDDPSAGVPLPQCLELPPTLIAAGGAIGNGITLLSTQLHLSGDIWVLDRQNFGAENLGTCVLLGLDGVGNPKAEVLAAELAKNPGLRPHPLVGDIASLKQRFGNDIPYPELILSGFDNVPARHQIQELWPDLLVDGGISEFGVQAVVHRWGSPHQCLKCHFVDMTMTDHKQIAADASGLSFARLANPDATITEEDISMAPPEKKAWLRARLGKTTCSVVSEATIAALAGNSGDKDFSPSVPFVACMSAALVMARAVRALMEPDRPISSRFTFDMLQGPANGLVLNESAKPTCVCTHRAAVINRWRTLRNGTRAPQ